MIGKVWSERTQRCMEGIILELLNLFSFVIYRNHYRIREGTPFVFRDGKIITFLKKWNEIDQLQKIDAKMVKNNHTNSLNMKHAPINSKRILSNLKFNVF